MTLRNQFFNTISDNRLVVSSLAQIFSITGKKPWKFGYTSYKRKEIEASIQNNISFNDKLPPDYGQRLDERIVELPWFYSQLSEDPGLLLDAGSSLNFKYFLLSEKIENKKVFIATLAPEKRNYASIGVSYVYDDLRKTCFDENYFDNIACLSTLEHVGLDNTLLYTADQNLKENRPLDYLLVISEFKRILKPKGKLFLSFPFGEPANHGWFQVFGQDHVDAIIDCFQPTEFETSYFKYSASGWQKSTLNQCKEADTFDMTAGLDYTEDYLAFSRAVCCISLTK